MKYKIFIIFILTGLFIPLLALVSCNPKPEKLGGGGKIPTNTPDPRKQDPPKPVETADQQKQRIVNDLIALINLGIKRNITTHNNATWNEDKQKYNIKASNQLFGVIQYTDAQKQPKLYNTQDDESKTARREMYLGLRNISRIIKAFGALANKMVAAQNVQMKTDLENMVDKIRQYGTAFYLTAYNTLTDKQDKLMELDLNDLQTLKAKFKTINSSDKKIYSEFAYSIYDDHDKNIEVGTAKHTLQDNATAEEIQDYLNGKFTSVESDFDAIIKEALDVAGILNKIQ
ncbi:CRASP family complement regulator-acquiring lipoprotein [Borrelia nietonii]|uniref:CRASP family complement regulator-acquiring lipoprotein n=1 Tax=Borrelia nietonii TaxID=3117462 RepID=UPI00046D5FBF|nr:CRASP family complement regulator-acquiring lipoprotein [Borrelia nietonii]